VAGWRIEIYKDDTIKEKMRAIGRAVALGLVEPSNHERVIAAIRNACKKDRDDACEVNAIWNNWKHNGPRTRPLGFYYLADPRGFDTYRAAHRTWAMGAGDCDDATVALITDLKLAGFATAAKVIAPNTAGVFEHIYAMVGLPKDNPQQWFPLDLTVPTAYPGWEPPPNRRLAEQVFVF